MGMLHSIWYGKEEPPRNNVLWAKPVNGGFAFYVFDGKWKPQKVMDDNSSTTTDDDEVLPLEHVEVNEPYTNVYIGMGEEITDVLVPANLHENIQKGETISFDSASGYIYAVCSSDRLPILSMSNYLVPVTTDTVTIDGVTYYLSKSINFYGNNIKIEIN